MSEMKAKVSWLSGIVGAIVGAALTIGGVFGLVTAEQKANIMNKAEVVQSFAILAAEAYDQLPAAIEKIKADLPKEDCEALITAIKAKDFAAAYPIIVKLHTADIKASAALALDPILQKVTLLKEIAALMKKGEYTKAKEIMETGKLPTAVTDATK